MAQVASAAPWAACSRALASEPMPFRQDERPATPATTPMTAADPLSGVEGRNKGIYPERTWLMTTVTAIPVPAGSA